MANYRVIKIGNYYYPQAKYWYYPFYRNYIDNYDLDVYFDTKEQAIEFISRAKDKVALKQLFMRNKL